MLDEIRAHNVGLITDAVLTPAPGLTVITGETGAGKTLILGALRLVTGAQASKAAIGPHADTADVSARFVDDSGGEQTVRRVVGTKRSRAYLNGVPATAGELTAAIGPLVTIIGQHDQHMLASGQGIRSLIDASFTDAQRAVYRRYREAFTELRSLEAERDALGSDRRGLERELAMTRFQAEEIDTAGFAVGDEEALRSRLERLRNAEELSQELTVASQALGDDGIESAVAAAATALERVVRIDPDAGELLNRITDAATAISEIAGDVDRYASGVTADSSELASDEQRLALLADLKRKYGDTIADIAAFAEEAKRRTASIQARLASADTLEESINGAMAARSEAAAALTVIRTAVASAVSVEATRHLRDLGFADPVVTIVVAPKEPGPHGADRIEILFASDSSLTPAPIGSVASGGELSRLVLAVTLACGAGASDVIAFDEIDAGIGGETALAMGEKLASLAQTNQVICVTHLPQVAAHGDHHFAVVRTGTTATLEALDGDRRVAEISRMLAGMKDSRTARKHARELLARAVSDRADLESA